jgi:hypothetical protein
MSSPHEPTPVQLAAFLVAAFRVGYSLDMRLKPFVRTGTIPSRPRSKGRTGSSMARRPIQLATTISIAYSITSSGKFSTLDAFTNAEGQNVYGGLVQGTDGNPYWVARRREPTGLQLSIR